MTFLARAGRRSSGHDLAAIPGALAVLLLSIPSGTASASPATSATSATAAVATLAPGAAGSPAARPADAKTIDRSAWESGWHVVRPGDTLEGLADRYLGSPELWPELHTLNPFVQDPNLLFPGQRLRIFLERPTAKLSAQVTAIARDVRELPTPVSWRPASEGDVLLERDALRTAESASAQLRFDDGATVTLSEASLVFIRNQSPSALPAVLPRKEIEIQVGQADVTSAPAQSARTGGSRRNDGKAPGAIEVVVGGARSLASPSAEQPLAARSRKGAGDVAQFMIYTGQSKVSAAGTSVDVPAGSGTSVAPKAKPGPVEALLPAPAGLHPADGDELGRNEPELSWSAVPGAASYTVEICRDTACGALVDRQLTIASSPYHLPTAADLLTGELYWRVTAVAPSGLDGFPSPATRFTAVDSVAPPAPTLALRTSGGAPIPSNGCLAALPDIEVRAVDRSGGALPWTLRLDGRETSIAALRAMPLSGRHELSARATDARGRTADSASVPFIVDAAAPWVDLVATAPAPATATPDDSGSARRHRRAKKEPPVTASCDSGLELLAGDGAWTAIPCSTSDEPDAKRLRLDAAHTSVALRTAGAAIYLGGMATMPQESLSLNAWDVGCGSAEMSVRIVPSPYRAGRMLLEVEIADAAGNRRTLGWHITR
ncbi:MAG: LysM peptidoglycan-binding domain-containing protein [Thermoanaerobaculia bacterium]